ncbi:MAG: hypothetical protein KDD61_04290 [Bdellovibrionales bacterium]|nr:hypothetical protein [Bdellovibrionales bacterium]
MGLLFFTIILLSIVLGYLTPYYAMIVGRYSFLALAILLYASSTVIEWKKISIKTISRKNIALALFLGYVTFPLLQWILATSFIEDKEIIFGMVLTSLAPIAIVAPYFVNIQNGEKELSFFLVLTTTLLFPIYTPFLFHFLSFEKVGLFTRPIFIFSLLLFSVPTLLGLMTQIYSRKITEFFRKNWGIINLVFLSILIYSIFGSAANKVSTQISLSDKIGIVLVSAFQDIGVYALSLFALPMLVTKKTTKTIAITLCMKNVAATGVVLLLYWPNAAICSALVFCFHLFLFSYFHRPTKSARD